MKYSTSVLDSSYHMRFDCATDHAYVGVSYAMPCPHHHRDYEIYFLMSGNRKYFIYNTITTLCPNQIVIFKPNVPHQVTMDLKIPYERNLIYIAPPLFSEILRENSSLRSISDIQLYNLPESDFRAALDYIRIINEELAASDAYTPAIIKSVLAQLLGFILRHNTSSDMNIDKGDLRIQAAIDHILENYSNAITLGDCAKIACMSTTGFSKAFHRITATTFQEFLNKIRIEHACELLQNPEQSVAQIAQTVGFSTESHFSYIFKKRIHVSPTAYRAWIRDGRKAEDSDLLYGGTARIEDDAP